MKLLFINPCIGSIIPNLGLAYLMAALPKKHKIRLFDFAFRNTFSLYPLEGLMRKEEPEIIGISTDSFSVQVSYSLASELKKKYPQIKIIFGGSHPSIVPQEVISKPFVDGVCIGEGEISLNQYLDNLESGSSALVPGFWYKTSKGEIIRGAKGDFIKNLDSLPFPKLDYFSLKQYLDVSPMLKGLLPVLGSRGCLYSCAYCSEGPLKKTMNGKRYRIRKPEMVVKELLFLVEKYDFLKFRGFLFLDDAIVDSEEFYIFCEIYKNEKKLKPYTWIFQTTAQHLSRKFVRTAKEAGSLALSFGVESGDSYIRRKVYKKSFLTNKVLLRADKVLKSNNLPYRTNLMVGCKEESLRSIIKSIILVSLSDCITFNVSWLQPLPGTEIAGQSSFESESGHSTDNLTDWRSNRMHPDRMPVIFMDISVFVLKAIAIKKLFNATIKYKLAQKNGYKNFLKEILKGKKINHPFLFSFFEQHIYEALYEGWKKERSLT